MVSLTLTPPGLPIHTPRQLLPTRYRQLPSGPLAKALTADQPGPAPHGHFLLNILHYRGHPWTGPLEDHVITMSPYTPEAQDEHRPDISLVYVL